MEQSSILRLALIAAAIVSLDQLSKFIVLESLSMYETIPVIQGFFNVTHIHNPGGAFGLFAKAGEGLRQLLFLGISLVALFVVFYFYRTTPRSHPFLSFGFALIFSGAIGNLIDRFRIGEVIDFLDFYINGWHWPAFNVADSAVTIGISICAFLFLFDKTP